MVLVVVALALRGQQGSNRHDISMAQAKAVAEAVERGTSGLRAFQLAGCGRGNFQRGYLLLRARSLAAGNDPNADLAPLLFSIIDCDDGQPLRPAEQEEFLRLLSEERAPVVIGGTVVGSRPLRASSRQ